MFVKLKSFIQENLFICLLIPPVAVSIITSSVLCSVSIWKILPLMVSLVVMVMQSSANRYAFLLGSLNSILYIVVYISMTLYSSAASAFFMSFLIQLVTFIRWNKRAYKQTTVFKKLSWKRRGLITVISVCMFVAMNIVFSVFGSEYMLLDNITFVISIITSVLSLLSYIEYSWIQVAGCLVSTVMYLQMISRDLTALPYIIYNAYCLICVTKAIHSVNAAYKEQQLTEISDNEGHKKENCRYET